MRARRRGSRVGRHEPRIERRGPSRHGLALALALLAAAAPLAAGTLEVDAGAAFAGGGDGFGAELDPVETCISPDDRTVDSPATIEGFFAACDDLVVQGVAVGAAGATLAAGASVELGDGFSAPAGNDLVVRDELPLSRDAYLTDETPDAQTAYRAAYRLDLRGLTLGASDSFASLVGYSADGTEWFRVIVSRNAALAEDRVRVRARRDDGSEVEGLERPLPAEYNLIEVRWVAGVGNGSLVLAVNGSVFTGVTMVDNDQGRIDSVRWGIVDGDLDATTGTLDQDEFDSWP